ncbi:hypothetical protein ABPG74_005957 [Tetrahymena malaccensis]
MLLKSKVESNQKYNCCPNCKKPYNSEKVLKQSTQLECNVQCVICYSSYTQESIPCSLPCNHFFHKDCLVKWGESCKSESSPCPYCRKMYQDKDIQLRWDVFAKLQKFKLGQNETGSTQQDEDEFEESTISSISSAGLDVSIIESISSKSDTTNIEDQITGTLLQEISSKLSEEKSEKPSTKYNEISVTSKNQQIQINNSQTQNKEFKQNQAEKMSQNNQLETIDEEDLQQATNISQNNTKKTEKVQREQKIENKIDDEASQKNLISNNSQKSQHQNTFQIFVQDLNGQTFIVNVSQKLNVKEFAKIISEKSNIEPEQLRFTCQGKSFSVQNNSEELLGNLKVEKNSIVHMLLKLKGGINYEQEQFI